jgi:hypothetical protein
VPLNWNPPPLLEAAPPAIVFQVKLKLLPWARTVETAMRSPTAASPTAILLVPIKRITFALPVALKTWHSLCGFALNSSTTNFNPMMWRCMRP